MQQSQGQARQQGHAEVVRAGGREALRHGRDHRADQGHPHGARARVDDAVGTPRGAGQEQQGQQHREEGVGEHRDGAFPTAIVAEDGVAVLAATLADDAGEAVAPGHRHHGGGRDGRAINAALGAPEEREERRDRDREVDRPWRGVGRVHRFEDLVAIEEVVEDDERGEGNDAVGPVIEEAQNTPNPHPRADVNYLAGQVLGPVQLLADELHAEEHPKGVDVGRDQADDITLCHSFLSFIVHGECVRLGWS